MTAGNVSLVSDGRFRSMQTSLGALCTQHEHTVRSAQCRQCRLYTKCKYVINGCFAGQPDSAQADVLY